MPDGSPIERKASVLGILIRIGMNVEHGMYRLAVRTSDGQRFELRGLAETEDLQEMIGESILVRGAFIEQGNRKIVHVKSYDLLDLEEDDERYDFEQPLYEDV